MHTQYLAMISFKSNTFVTLRGSLYTQASRMIETLLGRTSISFSCIYIHQISLIVQRIQTICRDPGLYMYFLPSLRLFFFVSLHILNQLVKSISRIIL